MSDTASRFTERAEAHRPVEPRHRIDRAFVVFCVITAFISVCILAFLLIAILVQGLPHLSWQFLIGIPDPDPELAGIRPALGGTIWICLVCALFTLPIGVATAIFLEEFKPRHPIMRFFHGVVQLNITNLAGVPSVVYGIIGLTAFVSMFGLFGQPKDPTWEIGVEWFDQFGTADSDGLRAFNVPVKGQSAPSVTIAPNTKGDTRFGNLEVNMIGAWDALPTDRRIRSATIRLGSVSERIEVDGNLLDEFKTFSGKRIRVAVDNRSAEPTKVTRGMRALDESGKSVRVKVIDSESLPTVYIRADTSFERVKVDDESFDQFETSDAYQIRIPVDDETSPTTKIAVDETAAGITSFGRSVNVVGSDTSRRSKYMSRFDEMLRADPEAGRIPRPSWYYFRLPIGRGVLAGALTLMLVILPIVIIASQESLRAVPDSLREGAFGMGATPWQVVWNVTLPASIPGIMTGSILAMSRAIGEAAPILIICGIVFIGASPGNLMDNFTVLPLQIYNWASRPEDAFREVAAAGILVLLTALLTFNGIAVFIRHRMQKPLT